MTIASFRRKSVPRLDGDAPKREREKFRGSARERGYTREWDALAAEYKKSIAGQCEECLRRGYLHQCDVIDHMMPVTDEPDHRLDKHNLDGLCHVHHNASNAGLRTKLHNEMSFPEGRRRPFVIMPPIWFLFWNTIGGLCCIKVSTGRSKWPPPLVQLMSCFQRRPIRA